MTLHWGIASSFVLIELGDSHSYGLCWEVSIFSTRSRDRWICWRTLVWSSSAVVDSDALLYTGACPSFGGRSDWFLTLEHLPDDMEIIGLFHVVLIAYWSIAGMESVFSWEHSRPIGSFTLGHSHLVGGFDIEAWLPVCDYCFSMDYRVIDTSGLVFSAYLDDLEYLPTFHFILRHFTHGYFHTFYHTGAWPSPFGWSRISSYLLSYTSYHYTWPHLSLD